MDVSDSGEFGRRLVILSELFDLKLSATRQALYFEALRDIPFDAVAQALNQAARSCTFFPKPAELRTFAIGDVEDHTEVAWMAFRKAVPIAGAYASLVMDAPLGDAVLAVFGSWPEACHADFSPEMWASKRKEFGRVYRVMLQRQLDGVRYLPGLCEVQNAGRREWMAYVPVSRLEAGGVVHALTLMEAEEARTAIGATAHGLSRLGGVALRLEGEPS